MELAQDRWVLCRFGPFCIGGDCLEAVPSPGQVRPSFLVPTGLHKKLCTLLAGKPEPAFGLHLTEPGDGLIVECQCCHGIGVRDRCHSRQDVQGEREIDLGAGAMEDAPCLLDERHVVEPVPHLEERARPLDGHAHGLGRRNAALPSS